MKIESLPPLPAQTTTTSKKRWRAPLIALVVIALAGGGWTVMQGKNKGGDKPMAMNGDKGGPPKIDVYELARGDVAAIEARALAVNLPLSGSLTPQSQATVKSKVSGVVLETTVQEGMNVAAGQVLARLDTSDLKGRMLQQQGALEEAQARLALAQKTNANNLSLLQQKFISQSAADSTQTNVELAQANVKSMQAQLDLARIALADAVIRAPIAGVISKRHVQAGEKVAPDMSVFSIVNLQQLTLEAQVPAAEIPRIKVGQDVLFKVDGFNGRVFNGQVARINPTTEAGSRSLLVYIAVANTDGALRGGMFAKGNITTEKSKVVPLVPVAALRQDKGGQVVYKIENNKVVAQPVTTGLRNDDEGYAEVTGGLAAGASVIVAKLDGVKPGAKVKFTDSAPAAAASAASASPLAKKG